MTTALSTVSTVAADPVRIPAIAADLLPAEVVARRRGRKVRRIVLTALLGVVVLLAGWYVTARRQTTEARAGLADAEASGLRVEEQKKAYQQVVGVQAESAQVSKQLTELMALDLRWSTLVVAVQAAAPDGVTLHGMSGATNTPGAAASGSDAQLSGGQPIGTLTLTGSGTSKAAVAGYVDALGKVAGVANPLLSSAVEQKSGVDFTVRMDLTKALLGGRYSKAGGN
jgi:Fimbrial assembly protein (PilN)